MADRVLSIADGFWNIRGSFKIKGLIDIGTHCSLVRRQSGGFVLLDSYALEGDVEREVRDLTDGGDAIEAILNLHPFHTVHVKAAHAQFPKAKLYGTARHLAKAPDLPWETLKTEDEALHQLFADDLAFFVPRGVDFISKDENVHFSSVLAVHPASETLHVDDTLTYTKLPLLGGIRFHPTLKAALERRKGAADDFESWGEELAAACAPVRHLCAAHSLALRAKANTGASISDRVRSALEGTRKTLDQHRKRFG